jgi:serine/threonine protein kinase
MNASDDRATSPSSVLAELVDRLTAKMQAGEAVDWEEAARRHPEHAGELLRLRPALGALDDLSKSGPEDLSGVAPPAVAGDGAAAAGVLGDYRIVREVGRGGMGIVYEAEQISLNRRVALKVLPLAATMDPRHLQRFHNEARAAAGLHHTNIVPVYFVGCDRGVHFYAMQFIDGRPLAALVQGLRRPAADRPTTTEVGADAAADDTPPDFFAALSTRPAASDPAYFRRVAEWGAQAAEALEYAHQMGVVHRDVKPANLMLDGAGRLWVTDFGLAQVQCDVRLTRTGDVVGTLRYMSPEQAAGGGAAPDHRADVYSLGATLYELLTLVPAFGGDDGKEVLRRVAFDDPTPPRRLNRAIPAELEIIVLKALEKRPEDRYPTAQQLSDDLRNFLADRPLRARRPGLLDRAGKWARRHRPLVRALGIGFAVAFVALAVAAGWAWHKERQAEDARQYADEQRRHAEANAAETAEQRERALENFRKAVKVVTGLLNEEYQTRNLRLASEAILVLQELLKGETPTDPEGRRLTAQAYEGLGTAHLIRGELVEAAKAYVRARDICAQLAAEFPQESIYQQEASRIQLLRFQGWNPYQTAKDAANDGRHEAAARAFRDSLKMDAIFGTEINGHMTLFDQAFCDVGLADELRVLGRRQEAEQADGEALASCEPLAKTSPELLYPPVVVGLKARALGGRGLLRAETERLGDAETDLRQALDVVDGLEPGEQEVPLGLLHDRARIRSALGNVLWAESRREQATDLFCTAEQEWRQAKSNPVRDNELAWFLTTCPDEGFRNPKEAVALANQAVKGIAEKEPWRTLGVVDRSPWQVRRTLGVAFYRNGDWTRALDYLKKAADLRPREVGAPPDPAGGFFQAMAEWQLGDKQKALWWHDAAVNWMKKSDRLNDEELRRFREEAEQLLGIDPKKD